MEQNRISTTTLLSRLHHMFEQRRMNISIDERYMSHPTWSVAISRDGMITFPSSPHLIARDIPHASYRRCINLLNVYGAFERSTSPSNYLSLDLQYDSINYTSIPRFSEDANLFQFIHPTYTESQMIIKYRNTFTQEMCREEQIIQQHFNIQQWAHVIYQTIQALNRMETLRHGEMRTRLEQMKDQSIQQLMRIYTITDTSRTSIERAIRRACAIGRLSDLRAWIHLLPCCPHISSWPLPSRRMCLTCCYSSGINAIDDNPSMGRAAAHWAALKGHHDCYRYVIEQGARMNIIDVAQHMTPPDYARQHMHAWS